MAAREQRINLRLSDEEAKLVEEYCQDSGTEPATAFRILGLGAMAARLGRQAPPLRRTRADKAE